MDASISQRYSQLESAVTLCLSDQDKSLAVELKIQLMKFTQDLLVEVKTLDILVIQAITLKLDVPLANSMVKFIEQDGKIW